MILLSVILLFSGMAAAQNAQQPSPAENAFTSTAASALLRQLSEALEAHSQKKLLGLVDFSQMKDGPLFREQLISFLSQSEQIRVHLNLAEVSGEDKNSGMSVDAEMEVEPANGRQAWRRSERLRFIVTRTGNGWRFIDAQPRSFFSN